MTSARPQTRRTLVEKDVFAKILDLKTQVKKDAAQYVEHLRSLIEGAEFRKELANCTYDQLKQAQDNPLKPDLARAPIEPRFTLTFKDGNGQQWIFPFIELVKILPENVVAQKMRIAMEIYNETHRLDFGRDDFDARLNALIALLNEDATRETMQKKRVYSFITPTSQTMFNQVKERITELQTVTKDLQLPQTEAEVNSFYLQNLRKQADALKTYLEKRELSNPDAIMRRQNKVAQLTALIKKIDETLAAKVPLDSAAVNIVVEATTKPDFVKTINAHTPSVMSSLAKGLGFKPDANSHSAQFTAAVKTLNEVRARQLKPFVLPAAKVSV